MRLGRADHAAVGGVGTAGGGGGGSGIAFTRRQALATGLAAASAAAASPWPASAMTEVEARAAIGTRDDFGTAAKRGLGNDGTVFKEDFYYKFGKLPPPQVDIDMAPRGGMPFVPVKRRYAGYNKFAARVEAGAEQFGKIGLLLGGGGSPAWGELAELTQRTKKNEEGRVVPAPTAAMDLPLAGGLLANTLVQSENDGVSNAVLLARYFCNEVNFRNDDLVAAVAAKDLGAARAAWAEGRDYLNAYLSFVNQAINPRNIGAKFPLLNDDGTLKPRPVAAAAEPEAEVVPAAAEAAPAAAE